jgi:hypothetical protein
MGHLKEKTMNQGRTGLKNSHDETECQGNKEWGLNEDEAVPTSSKNLQKPPVTRSDDLLWTGINRKQLW